jgi:hypothetical protein
MYDYGVVSNGNLSPLYTDYVHESRAYSGVDFLHNIAHSPHTRFNCCNSNCYACNLRYFNDVSNVLTTVCKIMSAVNYLKCDVFFYYCNDVLRHFGLVSQYSSLILLNYTCFCKNLFVGTGFDCLQQLDNTCCNDTEWVKNNYFNALTGCCCYIFDYSCIDLACESGFDCLQQLNHTCCNNNITFPSNLADIFINTTYDCTLSSCCCFNSWKLLRNGCIASDFTLNNILLLNNVLSACILETQFLRMLLCAVVTDDLCVVRFGRQLCFDDFYFFL